MHDAGQVKNVGCAAHRRHWQIPRLKRVFLDKPHPVFKQRGAFQIGGCDARDGGRGCGINRRPCSAVVQQRLVHAVRRVQVTATARGDVGVLPCGIGQAGNERRASRPCRGYVVDVARGYGKQRDGAASVVRHQRINGARQSCLMLGKSAAQIDVADAREHIFQIHGVGRCHVRQCVPSVPAAHRGRQRRDVCRRALD